MLRRGPLLVLLHVLLLGGVAGGCVYDADDRCGPAMKYDAIANVCTCADNAVADGLGCRSCAPDEVTSNGACTCASGEAKNAGGICERVAGFGDACTTASDCSNAKYSLCAPATAGSSAGTCTSTCTTDDDCAASQTCATWEAQPYCRDYKGLGKSCSAQEDCAGTDATTCDTILSHQCIVTDCSLDSPACPRGTQCCDLSAFGFGTMCAEECP